MYILRFPIPTFVAFFSYNLRSPQLPAARQSEKQPVPGRTAVRTEDGGATKSGAAAETETLSNLLGAGGRGRFSGTMFSSELARHGGHCLRSLHRGAGAGALVRAAPMASVHEATNAPSRASAMSPPPAIPIAAHAAAATHAPRSACDADTPAAGACVLRAPAAACSGGAGGPRRRQQELMMVAAVEEGAAIYY